MRQQRPGTPHAPSPARPIAPAPAPRLYYGWPLVGALGVTTIVSYGTTQYLFGVLVVPITRELGWSRASISSAFALGVLVSGLLGLPIGRLVDRHGARALMSAGSALAGLALLALSTVQQDWQFALLWAGGLGLAMALTFYPVSFTVVAHWFRRRRGAALALLTVLGGLASPIFIPLAGHLVATLGWRRALVALALAQLLVALPLHALVLRRHPEDLGLRPDGEPAPAGDHLDARRQGLPLRAALGRPAFWTLTLAVALAFLGAAIMQAHQIAYVVGQGRGEAFAAALAGGVGLASLPGRFLLNLASDRLGAQRLLAACLALQALGVLLLLAARSAGWLVAYAVVYGAAFGAISPLRAAVMGDQFGRRAYGAIIAAQGLPVALCAAAGPLVAGVLYDRLGGYGLAFRLTAAAFVLAAFAVLATPAPVASGER